MALENFREKVGKNSLSGWLTGSRVPEVSSLFLFLRTIGSDLDDLHRALRWEARHSEGAESSPIEEAATVGIRHRFLEHPQQVRMARDLISLNAIELVALQNELQEIEAWESEAGDRAETD